MKRLSVQPPASIWRWVCGAFVLAALSLPTAWLMGQTRATSASVSAPSSLRAAIPSDALFFAHWYSEPGDGFADRYLKGVRRAVRSSGLIEEYIRNLRKGVPEEDLAAFNETSRYWQRILGEVDWWRLFSHEVVVGARLGGRIEIVMLCRVGEKARDETLLALRRILYGLAGAGDSLELEVGDREGVPTTVIYSRLPPEDHFCVSGKGDVVVMGTTMWLVRQSLRLLEGKGSDVGFVHTSRYKESRRVLGTSSPGTSSFLEVLYEPGELLEKDLPSLDLVQRFHLLAEIAPRECRWNYRLDLKERKGSALFQALASQRPVADWLRYVPATSRAFEITAGSDPALLYDFGMDLLAELTWNDALPDLIEETQKTQGFLVKDDLLRYLSGRRGHLVFPPTEGSDEGPGRASGQRVFFFEIKPTDAARQAVRRQIRRLAEKLREMKVDVKDVRFDGSEGEFHSVNLKALLGLDVIFGATPAMVYVATSAPSLELTLRTAAGKQPSILKKDGFTWNPPGQLESFSYGACTDSLGLIEETLRWLGILSTFLPENQGPGILKPFLQVLPRIGSIVKAFHFLGEGEEATTRQGSTYLGNGKLRLYPTRRW